MEFLLAAYQELNGQRAAIERHVEALQASSEQDVKTARAKSSKAGAKQQGSAETEQPPPETTVQVEEARAASELLLEQMSRGTHEQFNQVVGAEDFGYELTEQERTTLSYQRGCYTVVDGRSYRIAPTDVTFSNLPFLTFLVSGAPLSGKSGLCRKI